MSESNNRWDPWSIPAALAWVVFFFAGLDPERLFYTLRTVGEVDIMTAMVNSPHLITLAFSAYLGLFVYQRCIEHGLARIEAKARALQFGILGLVAFLNFSLVQVFQLPDIPVANLRVVVLVVAFAKVTAWFFLLITVLRYSVLGHAQVFTHMVSLFPSTYVREGQEETLGKSSSVEWIDSGQGTALDPEAAAHASSAPHQAPKEAGSRVEQP